MTEDERLKTLALLGFRFTGHAVGGSTHYTWGRLGFEHCLIRIISARAEGRWRIGRYGSEYWCEPTLDWHVFCLSKVDIGRIPDSIFNDFMERINA